MLSFNRLAKIGYLLVFSLVVYLLVWTNASQAQKGFGVSTGYRATPGLPTIAIAVPNVSGSGVGGSVGGGASGFGGSFGGGSGSVSFNPVPQIVTLNLGQFFPNNGQIIGLPPATMMPALNNFGPLASLFPMLPSYLMGFPFSDSTGAPWSMITALGIVGGGGGGGIGGGGIAGGGLGGGGIAGGGLGGLGGGAGGIAGGVGGFNAGMGGIGGGGMGGFAGKGFGGFNGRKPL